MKRLSMAIIAIFFFAACNGPAVDTTESNDSAAEQEAEAMETEMEEEVEETSKAVTLNLTTIGETMTDMAFEPSRLTVSPGAQVTLILENKATAEAMIHNAVFIQAGKQTEVIEAAMAAGPDKDYIGESEYLIAATGLAKPGETVEVVFTAPLQPGTYQYICTYPGHTAMKGIFLVK